MSFLRFLRRSGPPASRGNLVTLYANEDGDIVVRKPDGSEVVLGAAGDPIPSEGLDEAAVQALIDATVAGYVREGGPLLQGLDADGHAIGGLADPSFAQDATNKRWVEDSFVGLVPATGDSWEAEHAYATGEQIAALDSRVYRQAGADAVSGETIPDFATVPPGGSIDDGSGSWVFVGFAGEPAFARLDGSIAALGFVKHETVELSTEQIGTLFSETVEVVPAPGEGKSIVLVSATGQFTTGDHAFAANVTPFVAAGDSGLIGAPMGSSSANADNVIQMANIAGPSASATPGNANEPVIVGTDSDAKQIGGIVTAPVAEPGTGYAPGDTGDFSGGSASYEVDTITEGGGVETYHLTDPGAEYAVGDTAASANESGVGTGFTANVTEIDPLSEGTLRVTVVYYVVDLLGAGPS